MLRTAMQPRWLAMLALALVLAAAFAGLGSWQLDRAQRDQPSEVDPGRREPVPLDAVAAPQQQLDADAVAGPVVVTGTYQPDLALVVVGPELDGRAGWWVVVPVAVATDLGPARLAVVLGWTGGLEGVPAVVSGLPAGATDVVGRLQFSQQPSGPRGDLAPGQVRSLSSADLVNRWGTPVYSGFLLADQAPAGLETVPAPTPDGGLQLLNVSYALQWWVFAAFAVFIWWRLVRDAHRQKVWASSSTGPGDTGRDPPADPPPAGPEPVVDAQPVRSEHP